MNFEKDIVSQALNTVAKTKLSCFKLLLLTSLPKATRRRGPSTLKWRISPRGGRMALHCVCKASSARSSKEVFNATPMRLGGWRELMARVLGRIQTPALVTIRPSKALQARLSCQALDRPPAPTAPVSTSARCNASGTTQTSLAAVTLA